MLDLATVGVEFQSRGAEALKTDLAQAGQASKETQAGLDEAALSGENLYRTSRQLADQLGRRAQEEQQAKQDLDLLDAALKRGKISQQRCEKAVEGVDRNLRRLGTSAEEARNSVRGVNDGWKSRHDGGARSSHSGLRAGGCQGRAPWRVRSACSWRVPRRSGPSGPAFAGRDQVVGLALRVRLWLSL
ncbi:MAG: hypothetical protein AAGA32_21270 [Pseudomonadota bacterium]